MRSCRNKTRTESLRPSQDLIWPVTGELESRTETELKKKALETRITLLVDPLKAEELGEYD